VNNLVLDAEVMQIAELRYTPAGLPLLSIVLQHRSQQVEAGMKRKVDCEVNAVLLGDIASSQLVEIGAQIKVSGFLAKRSLKSTQLVMHINHIAQIEI
jgi:primosomal replication protein N